MGTLVGSNFVSRLDGLDLKKMQSKRKLSLKNHMVLHKE